MFNRLFNNATINNTNAQEEETMTNNNAIATVNAVETKEEKRMSWREMFNAERAKARAISMEKGIGYGVGYTMTTVKEEAKGIGRAIADTKAGQVVKEAAANVKEGYYDGCNDAMMDYTMRKTEREEKRRARKDAKAIEAAAQELMDEFEF